MQGKNLLLGLLTFIILLGGLSLAMADCTGCGDDGHQVCPIEKKHKHVTIMKEEHAESSSSRLFQGTPRLCARMLGTLLWG